MIFEVVIVVVDISSVNEFHARQSCKSRRRTPDCSPALVSASLLSFLVVHSESVAASKVAAAVHSVVAI